jgi:hypothetical protein
MKTIGILVVSVFGLALLIGGGMLIQVIFFPVNTAQKMIDTAYQAQNKTLNADNAIYNYEWFKQTYQDINAQKAQLSNAQQTLDAFNASAGNRKDWTFEDKNEQGRLSSVVLGLKNNLEQTIANYNARASMANRNIFQNSILPSFINSLTFITK